MIAVSKTHPLEAVLVAALIERYFGASFSLDKPRNVFGRCFGHDAVTEIEHEREVSHRLANRIDTVIERVAGMLAHYPFVGPQTLAYFTARPEQARREGARWRNAARSASAAPGKERAKASSFLSFSFLRIRVR